MSNAKKISVSTIVTVYDLALAFYEANPDKIIGDVRAATHVETELGMKLTEIKYQRAANVGTMIKSHEVKIKRGGSSRATVADADAVAAELYFDITGDRLDIASAAPASVKAGAKPAKSTSAAPAPVSRAQASTFKVSDGAEALMNPTIQTITEGKITSIDHLLSAVEAAESAQNEAVDLQDAYKAAIAAYKSGETDVDETALKDLPKFDISGYADLPTNNQMVAVLDNMLESKVEPTTSYAELIGRVSAAEGAIASSATAIKTLKRELRQAKPKERQKLDAAQTGAVTNHAQTLAEIDEINADCDVVMEIAADLFPQCYGGSAQVLGFEVPKLDFGTVHPDVPAIDPSFRFYTKVLVEALCSIADNQIIWLHGESGCGKSEFWAQVAAYLNMPFTRINLDGHLTRSDIVGGMKLVSDGHGGQETRFVEGALPRAMSQPGLLLIDEFDLGDPEIMPIFQPVLEGKPLVMLEDGGRIVHPHPMFRIALTGNTIGLGSDNQMYLNAFEQSAATRDRISAFVEMQYMPANIEQEVVMARMPGADPDFVSKLIQLANKVREGYRNQEIHQLFSTRKVQFCASRFAKFGGLYPTPEQAAADIIETVILNSMDGASRQVVKGISDNIF